MIVVSILLAFGLQAWSDGRQERRLEREALERLADEFAGVDSVLLEWQASHRSALAAGLEILEHTGPQGAPLLSVDSVGKLVGTLIFLATVEPPTGVLTSLIQSGQLGLIRNPELRTELASWQAVLADAQEDEDQVTRQVEISRGLRRDSP